MSVFSPPSPSHFGITNAQVMLPYVEGCKGAVIVYGWENLGGELNEGNFDEEHWGKGTTIWVK